jgi:hypothetical protein
VKRNGARRFSAAPTHLVGSLLRRLFAAASAALAMAADADKSTAGAIRVAQITVRGVP